MSEFWIVDDSRDGQSRHLMQLMSNVETELGRTFIHEHFGGVVDNSVSKRHVSIRILEKGADGEQLISITNVRETSVVCLKCSQSLTIYHIISTAWCQSCYD
jgi:hypothetical protein